MAPNGPVAAPKVRGRENIPAPTMDPTTIAVRANRESFCACWGIAASSRYDHVPGGRSRHEGMITGLNHKMKVRFGNTPLRAGDYAWTITSQVMARGRPHR